MKTQLNQQKQMREKKEHFPHACFKIFMLAFEPGTSYKMTVLSLLDAANILLFSVQKAKKDCTQNFDLRPYNLLNLSRYRCFLYESQIYLSSPIQQTANILNTQEKGELVWQKRDFIIIKIPLLHISSQTNNN